MEAIKPRTVEVNGIKMHVAVKGEEGHPMVLFLHGFPELWYTCRHQILSLGSLGFRAIAPDLHGFGDTKAPDSVASYTCFHIVGDVVELNDYLGVDQVFLVAHDWGAIIGWYLCMFRPYKVKAYVCLSVPLMPRNPRVRPLDNFQALYGDDYYICRFQEVGKTEDEIANIGSEQVLRNVLTSRKSGPPILPKQGFGYKNPSNAPLDDLPSCLSQYDLRFYASKFDKSGLTGPLNYYRNFDRNWELTGAWTGVKVKVPLKFITGELDCVYTSLGTKDYIESGRFKEDVPNLEEVVVQSGVAHFNNQEAADEINSHILHFINKF